jgi:hypothetical protein
MASELTNLGDVQGETVCTGVEAEGLKCPPRGTVQWVGGPRAAVLALSPNSEVATSTCHVTQPRRSIQTRQTRPPPKKNKVSFTPGKPFFPYEQLLAVQPPASCTLLPEPYQPLMTSPMVGAPQLACPFRAWGRLG